MRNFILGFAALSLAACSSSTTTPSDSGGGTDGTTPTDGSMPQDGGGDAAAPPYCPTGTTLTPFKSATRVASFTKADMVLENGKDYFAVIESDVGRIVLDLYEKDTPITVNSFVFLTLNHFYDGVAFHRVIEGFMAQGGDPNTVDKPNATWGTGGPGYTFGLEVNANLNFDARGVLGMARSTSPNSNGSQFFITFAAAANLNQMYTVFGKLTEGDAVLDLIKRGEPPGFTTPSRMTEVHICQK
jgi:peptidylprolyl isomerase